QRAFAAPAIGRRPGADAAGDAEDQRDRAEQSGQRRVDGEAAPDVDEQEGDDREVEPVEYPPEIGAGERLPLGWRDVTIPGALRASRCVEGDVSHGASMILLTESRSPSLARGIHRCAGEARPRDIDREPECPRERTRQVPGAAALR